MNINYGVLREGNPRSSPDFGQLIGSVVVSDLVTAGEVNITLPRDRVRSDLLVAFD